MYKYQFSIGFNHKETLQPVCGPIEGCAMIRDIAARVFGYATVYPAKGAYTMNNGDLVKEQSCICIVYGDYDPETVQKFADAVKNTLCQESVVLEKTMSNSEFI